MTVNDLIEILKTYPSPNDEIKCSVNCDYKTNNGVRVFGNDCMGINPYDGEATLLFSLEETNFKIIQDAQVGKDKEEQRLTCDDCLLQYSIECPRCIDESEENKKPCKYMEVDK